MFELQKSGNTYRKCYGKDFQTKRKKDADEVVE